MIARSMLATALAATFLAAAPAQAQSQASFAYGAGPAGSAVLVVNGTQVVASNRGWIDSTGLNNFGDDYGNYIVGGCSSVDACRGDGSLYNNYFAFDLSGFNLSSITSLVLELYQPEDSYGNPANDGYISPNPFEFYAVYSVDYINPLVDDGIFAFDDLADGTYFGGTEVSLATLGTTVSIDLTDGIGSAFAAQGGMFFLGGTLQNVLAPPPPPPVPEPGTWAMMLLGFGAVGGALRRRRAVLALA